MNRTVLFFLCFSSSLFGKTSALYLTFGEDPTTSMNIHFHGPKHEIGGSIFLQTEEDTWEEIPSTWQELRYLKIHTVDLRNLKPNTDYSFRIGREKGVYKFKTAPQDLKEPVRFIIGGDADQTKKTFRKMNETIVKKDPLFCVIGGDIAYAVDSFLIKLDSYTFNRWMSFFSTWKEQMITKEGRLIPLVVTAGNHDIREKKGDLFRMFFHFPEDRLYKTLDFRKYLSLILLDTDLIDPVAGKQTRFLERALEDRQHILYRFAVYHEGAYPSYYPYNGKTPTAIREHWCPLFDMYSLTAAFENHNHTYKKTHPIKGGVVDPNGIIYFGDGAWGTIARKPKDHWYLAEKKQTNNVYLIELSNKDGVIEAIDIDGETIDRTTVSPKLKI